VSCFELLETESIKTNAHCLGYAHEVNRACEAAAKKVNNSRLRKQTYAVTDGLCSKELIGMRVVAGGGWTCPPGSAMRAEKNKGLGEKFRK
jgi:hypothetical protein